MIKTASCCTAYVGQRDAYGLFLLRQRRSLCLLKKGLTSQFSAYLAVVPLVDGEDATTDFYLLDYVTQSGKIRFVTLQP
jgi:hypothetical protein